MEYPFFDSSAQTIYLNSNECYTIDHLIAEGKQGAIFSIFKDPNRVLKITSFSKNTNFCNPVSMEIWKMASNLHIGPFIYSNFIQDDNCFILMDRLDLTLEDYIYELESRFNISYDKTPPQIEKFIRRILKQECILDQVVSILKNGIIYGNFFKNDNLLSNFMIKYVDNKMIVYGIDFDFSDIIDVSMSKDDKKALLKHNNYIQYELQTIIDDNDDYCIVFDLELLKDNEIKHYLNI